MARPSGNGVAGPLPGLLGLLLGAVLPLALGLGLLPRPASRPWPSGQCAGDRRTLPGAGDRTPPPRPAYRTSTGIRKRPSTIEDLILLSSFCQSLSNHRFTAATRSLTSSPAPGSQTIRGLIPNSFSLCSNSGLHSARISLPFSPPFPSIATLQPPRPAWSTSRPE